MRILWFTNTYANAAEHLKRGPVGGGWLQALDAVLQQHVDLSIAFHYPKPMRMFKFGGTTYYPITPSNWKFRLLADNILTHVYDEEFLDDYLGLIEKLKPDLIHIHGTENPFGCIIGRTKIPVVVSIQGNITVYKHKYCSGLEDKYFKIRQLVDWRRSNYIFKSRLFYNQYKKLEKMVPVEQRNMKNCRFILGRTDWDRRIGSVLAPGAKYFHGDEMLRDEFYDRRWSPVQNDFTLIHSTTTNGYYKGFETICESLSLLNNLGFNVRWQVAGINESDLIVKAVKRKLGSKYPKIGLILLGSMNPARLVATMLKADLFVMTSHIENSPNSLCEAMLLGIPCIASFAGGTSSLLENNVEGILVQAGDPWALSGAILELVRNPQRALNMAETSRKRALYRHNKDRIVRELLGTYREIIDLNSGDDSK